MSIHTHTHTHTFSLPLSLSLSLFIPPSLPPSPVTVMLDEGAESLNLPHKITPGNSLLVTDTKREHEEEEKGIFSLRVCLSERVRECAPCEQWPLTVTSPSSGTLVKGRLVLTNQIGCSSTWGRGLNRMKGRKANCRHSNIQSSWRIK